MPWLSLSGRAGSGCMEVRPADWHRTVFEIAEPWRLELDEVGVARSVETGGVGHAIVHYFQCPYFVIDVEGAGRAHRRHEPLGTLESRLVSGLVRPSVSADIDRLSLTAIASSLRLDAREPFIYGYWLFISDFGSVSLRFDPTQRDERVLLHYRFEAW